MSAGPAHQFHAAAKSSRAESLPQICYALDTCTYLHLQRESRDYVKRLCQETMSRDSSRYLICTLYIFSIALVHFDNIMDEFSLTNPWLFESTSIPCGKHSFCPDIQVCDDRGDDPAIIFTDQPGRDAPPETSTD